MLTSKQRAQLRKLANGIDTIVHIGKDGVNENLIKQTEDALAAREIIKCRALETSFMTSAEAADALAEATNSEVVQTIGTRFVLYKGNPRLGEKSIKLVK